VFEDCPTHLIVLTKGSMYPVVLSLRVHNEFLSKM